MPCERPAQMAKPMPCEKPTQMVKPMPCEKPMPYETSGCTRGEEEDMDMRMYNKRRWNHNANDYNYGMKFDESCFDRDYMEYTKKMYCGCFREARPCPYRNEGSYGCDCK